MGSIDRVAIHATYDVAADRSEIDAIAAALAVEQSVEMPLAAIADGRVLDEVVGRVEAIEATAPGRFSVRLDLAAETVAVHRRDDDNGDNGDDGDDGDDGEHHDGPVPIDVAQLCNMLFGNCSLFDNVRLIDVELPPALVAGFAGPRFGLDGLRARFGATGRALSCTALKPQGMGPEALAALCGRFALAGLDVIKDDHGLADQPAAPFARRVEACQAAVTRANAATGHTTQYAPSLVGGPAALARQARVARDLGVQIVLVAPSLIGLATFAELVDTELRGMAVIAHPAFAGAARIDPPLLLGRLFRLLGADATIFPNVGGRFSYSAERCVALADAARRPWHHLAATVPVPAGGMTPDRVGEMVEAYGRDVMLLIGGGLLSAGDRLDQEAARFVRAVADAGS